MFAYIRSVAPKETPALDELFSYIQRTWIDGQWDPTQWSVFYKAVRTNNDCEGLHNRWNRKARGRKGFYWILSVLIEETKRIANTAQQLQYGCRMRERNAVSKRSEQQLFLFWDDYQAGQITSYELVQKCTKLLKRNFPKFDLISEVPSELDCREYDNI